MKKSNLKAKSYIILENKKTIKNHLKYLNSAYKQKILKNISQTLSNYYSSYPDETGDLK
ncbi:MAG: hypothetical protein IJJ04_02260 [Clostridia bacterium]|nr:hypothetical protein [Clostridia bacterium]